MNADDREIVVLSIIVGALVIAIVVGLRVLARHDPDAAWAAALTVVLGTILGFLLHR